MIPCGLNDTLHSIQCGLLLLRVARWVVISIHALVLLQY